jgi:cell wall-associated NlpC family hydrolase
MGKWYKWGGDDPAGIDCSGLVVECLRAVGLIGNKEDLSADALLRRFLIGKVQFPYKGCLVFWLKDGTAIHTGIMYDREHVIEAGGGDSSVTSVDDASQQNAFVRVRPWWYRGEQNVVFVNPVLKEVPDNG